MCFKRCLKNGKCIKVLPAFYQESKDGNMLYVPHHGNTKHYRGDCSWTKNPNGTWTVTEYHDIEMTALLIALSDGSKHSTYGLRQAVRDRLDNPLISAGMAAVRITKLYSEGLLQSVYDHQTSVHSTMITEKGKQQLSETMFKRLSH